MSPTLPDVHDNWRAPAPTTAAARKLRRRESRPQMTTDALGDPTFGARWEALTPREQEVMRARCAGRTRQQIAAALFIGENAVRSHLWLARRHLGLDGFGHAMIARTAYLLGRYDEANHARRGADDERCEGRR